MKILVNCVVIDMKQLLRSRLFYLGFIASLIYTAIGFSVYLSTNDFLNMLYGSQYSQIACMLLFLVIGLAIGGKEDKYDCTELFYTINSSLIYKSFSRFICGLVLCIGYFIVYLLILFFFHLRTNSTTNVFLHGIYYVILRGTIPNIVCILLGIIIGIQIKSTAKYPVALFVWIIISPVSNLVSEYVFEALQNNSEILQYFFSVLDLGGTISLDSAATYGLSLEAPRWILSGSILLLTILYYIFISVYAKHSRLRNVTVTICCIGILLGGIYFSSNETNKTFFVYYGYKSTRCLKYESSYYYKNFTFDNNSGKWVKNNTLIPDYDKAVHMQPIYYDISLRNH